MKKTKFIGGAIVLGIAALTLFTFIVMLLWNWLMPAIFSLGIITFWQAAGLLILSKILFSSSGHGSRWNADRKKKTWHSKMEEKWRYVPDDKKQHIFQKAEEKGFQEEKKGEE